MEIAKIWVEEAEEMSAVPRVGETLEVHPRRGENLEEAFAREYPHLTGCDFPPAGAQVAAAVLAERERCAKIAETLGVHPQLNVYSGGPDWYKHGKKIAARIRSGE